MAGFVLGDSRFTIHDSQFMIYDSRLTTHDSPLTTHDSPLTTHHSPLTTHDSRLTTHDSRLTTHDSRLTTHDSEEMRKVKQKKTMEQEVYFRIVFIVFLPYTVKIICKKASTSYITLKDSSPIWQIYT